MRATLSNRTPCGGDAAMSPNPKARARPDIKLPAKTIVIGLGSPRREPRKGEPERQIRPYGVLRMGPQRSSAPMSGGPLSWVCVGPLCWRLAHTLFTGKRSPNAAPQGGPLVQRRRRPSYAGGTYGRLAGGPSNVRVPVKDSRNAFRSFLSASDSLRSASSGSRLALALPPLAMMLMASSRVAALPSWK